MGGTADESQAFDVAFERLFALAYRAAYRVLASREDAEDVTLTALARASDRWGRIQGNPDAWVTAVAANLAIDIWRRRKRAPEPEVTLRVDSPDLDRVDLMRALQQLPRRQRQTLVLRYFADLTEAETATVLGCSVGAVKQHGARGTATLRGILGDEFREPGDR